MRSVTFVRCAAVVTTALLGLACGNDSGATHAAAGGSPGGGVGNANGGVGGSTNPDGGVGNTSGGSAPNAPGELALPIEVLGAGDPTAPTIAATQLFVPAADLATTEKLYVRCHRCGFYTAPAFKTLVKPVTKIKASLRVVGDASKPHDDATWVDITDANVQLDEMAAAHGGVNGAVVVTSFTLTLDAATRARLVAAPAGNSVEFRFNGTDGDSNGYRVLDVQLQSAAGKNLSPATLRWADISAEKAAGAATSEQAAQGEALWNGHDLLQESPIVEHTLRAACSSCHASDGRDLQYFNYSNNAIVQRSRFHGLTEAQGQRIASYLRSSLHDRVPNVKQAAPWNPPYQPGPGLDAKPVVEWAAGAGIDAVLPSAEAFAKAFVGQPIDDKPLALTQAEIDAVMDPTKTINIREMPIALELPDWNAWLPNVHPLDVWTPDAGQTEGSFETQGDEGHNPLKVVARAKAWLEAHQNPSGVYGDYSQLTPDERNQIKSWLGDVGSKTTDFGGGSRGTRQSSDPSKPFGCELGAAKLQAQADPATMAQFDAKAYSTQAFIERVNFGLYRWMVLQQWQLANTYGLEGDQTQLAGYKDETSKQWVGEGDVRGWLYTWPSLFYVAPHIIHAPEGTGDAHRENYFAWERPLDSYYRTNQWYQLQMTVNPGFPGASRGAMDWPYHLGFTEAVVDALRDAKLPPRVDAAHLLRFFQVRTKLSQLANTKLPFDAPDAMDPMNLTRNQGIQSKADLLNKLSPTGVLPKRLNEPAANRYVDLDAIMPGLHLLMLNGSIALYNGFFAGSDVSTFRRCDPNNMSLGGPEQKSGFRFCVDASRTPLPVDDKAQPYLPWSCDQWTTEQYSSWGVMAATALGAEPKRVAAWDAWNQSIWPK
jgi:hypothetical protein